MAANSKTLSFAEFNLTAETFPTFYNKVMALRFPIPVAEVLELRYLLNHTVDRMQQPPETPNYREFRDSLEAAIHSFGIENKRHCERLLSILTMLRDFHYYHSLSSRNAEVKLRSAMDDNRKARAQSVHYGLYFTVFMIAAVLIWLAMPEPTWLVKLIAAGSAIFAWDQFHSLPLLDRDMERLNKELNDTLRKRVNSLNWKKLIHKLALILGYKRISGVEVFRSDHEHDIPHGRRSLH